VERRLLLTLHEVAKKELVKSAKVVGFALGNYHPHGDASVYKTLVNLVEQGYAIGQGNWGSPGLHDDPPASYRYCVTEDTRILTNNGYNNIIDLKPSQGEDINEIVYDYKADQVTASKFFDSGKHPIIKIETYHKYPLKGSYNHPIAILDSDLEIKWKMLSEIKVGDFAILLGGIYQDPKTDILNKDYSKMLGCYVSEGWYHTSPNIGHNKIGFNNTDLEYFDEYYKSIQNLYENFTPTIQNQTLPSGKTLKSVEICNAAIIKDLENKGVLKLKSESQIVPPSIWKTSKENQKTFLQYLFAGDGTISFGKNSSSLVIYYISISRKLLEELQQLLLISFNIVSSITEYNTLSKEKRLVITGLQNCQEFYDRVGFFGQKQEKLKRCLDDMFKKNTKTRSKAERIPGIRDYLQKKYGSYFKRYFIDSRNDWDKQKSKFIHKLDQSDVEKIEKLINSPYRFEKIEKIETLESKNVYSIRVNSEDHSFIGNGFINHNTETKLEKWVEELAFEYIDYVPYEEFELEPEPLYLPCPLPLGLIGNGINIGISFYRTVIPKYKIGDLARRLVYLLDKKGSNIEIMPYFKNCDIQEILPGQFNSILTTGIGSLNIIPDGKLELKQIRIQGRGPTSSFSSLEKSADKLDINIIDESGSNLDIVIEPKKRGTNLQELGTKIWDDHLIEKVNFNCLFCDNEGTVNTYGIDEILINNYNLWKYSVKLKRVDDYNKLSNKKVDLMIVQIIRYIFETYKSSKIDDIIIKYHELKKTMDVSIEIDIFNIDTDKWTKEVKQINDKDIVDICNKRSIKNLVETVIDIQKVENDLVTARALINNIEQNCFDYIVQLKTA
jgi:DNA gyrase subunit A